MRRPARPPFVLAPNVEAPGRPGSCRQPFDFVQPLGYPSFRRPGGTRLIGGYRSIGSKAPKLAEPLNMHTLPLSIFVGGACRWWRSPSRALDIVRGRPAEGVRTGRPIDGLGTAFQSRLRQAAQLPLDIGSHFTVVFLSRWGAGTGRIRRARGVARRWIGGWGGARGRVGGGAGGKGVIIEQRPRPLGGVHPRH